MNELGEFSMLIITANWAIADGTIRGGPTQSVVHHFFQEIRRAAWRSGFRQRGNYKPIQSIKIILAGDTLDGLISLAWGNKSRPWHNDSRTQVVAEQIFMQTVLHGRALLKMLVRLSQQGIAVPSADKRGRPLPGSHIKVPVSIICLAGDRDHMLMGPWLTSISERFGIFFGNEWSSDTTVVRHGSEFDPLCGSVKVFTDDRAPTLYESLAIDLVLHFTQWLYDELPFGRATKQIGRLLTSISPLEIPGQMTSWKRYGRENGLSIACDKSIHDAWHNSVSHWYAQVCSSGIDTRFGYDAANALATWFSSTKNEMPHDFLPMIPSCSTSHSTRKNKTNPSNQRLLVLGHPPISSNQDVCKKRNIICLGQIHPIRQNRPHQETFPRVIVVPSTHSMHSQQTISLMDPTFFSHSRLGPVSVTPSGDVTHEKGIIDAA